MRAVVYLRQSVDRSGEELGISRQREDARKLAELRGWELAAEHVDNDMSAAGKRIRPGFESVLSDVTSGRAEVVIAWDMTRITRNARDRLRLIEAGKAAGTTVAFVRGTDLDLSTPAGRLTADILGSVAQHEIEQKSDRQRRAIEQAARDGRRIGGRRPFGYEADGMTIREGEADAVRRGFDAVLHGVPPAAVARDWNAAGLITPQGHPWSGQSVGGVLLNPRYAGIRAMGRGTGSRKTWDEIAPARWPELVSEETFRAVGAILRAPERRTAGRRGRRLLTGVAACGVCGARVHAGATAARSGGHGTYRCSESMGHVTRRADPVDEYVNGVIVERLRRLDAHLLLAERPDLGQLAREAGAVRARLEELGTAFAEGEIDRRTLVAGSERLRARLAELEARQAVSGRSDVLGALVGAQDVEAAYRALDTDRQRLVIDLLVTVRLMPPGRGTRIFRPETVQIEWR